MLFSVEWKTSTTYAYETKKVTEKTLLPYISLQLVGKYNYRPSHKSLG